MKLSSAIFAAVSALVVTAVPLNKRSAPLPPSEDPFYTPPAGYESQPLGAILSSRKSPNPPGLFDLKDNLKGTYQILYRTSDALGNAEATVTTVLIPHNADFSKIVSYQVAEDSAALNCAVSYVLQAQSNPSGISSQVEILAIETALNLGYVVITPDYEGPQAAFTSGAQAGHAVLDNVRAALQSSSITGIDSNAQVALWGYSGGSLASGWAAELAPQYAPELEFVGVAVGGLIVNISDVAVSTNSGPFVGLVTAGINGLAQQYPDFAAVVNAELSPKYKATFEAGKTQCLLEDIEQRAFQNWFDFFTDGSAILQNPVVQQVMGENTMGQFIPKAPFLVYHAENDEIAPFRDVEWLYNLYCSEGANIDLRKDLTGEHITEMILGVPQAIAWIQDRFNGVALKNTCSSTAYLSAVFEPGALETLGADIFAILTDLLGEPVGPSSLA